MKKCQETLLEREAVVVFLATAFAYWISFEYEKNFLAIFGIPRDFVEIEISKIVSAGAFVCLVYWLIPSVVLVLSTYISSKYIRVVRHLMMAIPFLFVVAIMVYHFQKVIDLPGIRWAVLIYGAFLIVHVVLLIIRIRNRRRFQARQKASKGEEPKTGHFESALSVMRKGFLYDRYLYVTAYALLGLLVSMFAGSYEAERRTLFLATKVSGVDALLIRNYGSKAIFVSYDKQSKELKDEFMVVST